MKNQNSWKPTKYVVVKNKLRASRDSRHITAGSRLTADITARYYDTFLPKFARGKLLDLGCGHVPLYSAYAKYADSVTCVDWENSLHQNPYLDFTHDLNEKLPFDDNEFDTIILSDVLEHIREPQKLVREIARILKKDGTLLMNVPFYYFIHEMPYDYYRYTEFALKQFMNDAGLTIAHIDEIGGALEVLADITSKLVMGLSRKCAFLAGFIQWCAALFGKTWFGKKIYAVTKKRFPLAYFVVAKK